MSARNIDSSLQPSRWRCWTYDQKVPWQAWKFQTVNRSIKQLMHIGILVFCAPLLVRSMRYRSMPLRFEFRRRGPGRNDATTSLTDSCDQSIRIVYSDNEGDLGKSCKITSPLTYLKNVSSSKCLKASQLGSSLFTACSCQEQSKTFISWCVGETGAFKWWVHLASNGMSRCGPSPTDETVSCYWLRILILSVPHSTHEC